MQVKTISYLKKNAANLELSEPMIITQNGEPAYVVESYEDCKKRDETIALLKLLTLSSEQADKQQTINTNTLRARITKRRNSEKQR